MLSRLILKYGLLNKKNFANITYLQSLQTKSTIHNCNTLQL